MSARFYWRLCAACALAVSVRAADFAPTALALSDNGKRLWTVGALARELVEIDTQSGAATRTLSLPLAPSGLAVSGDMAYVTAGSPRGEVLCVDLKAWKLRARRPSGHTPVSPVLSGKTLYVADRFGDAVRALDAETLETRAAMPAVRDPCALAVSPKDGAVWAANLLPVGRADGDFIAACVSVFQNGKRRDIALENGAQSVRAVAVSPDGGLVAAAHLLSRYALPATQVDKGWINTNALTIFDAAARRVLATYLLDDVETGAPNPWALGFSDDGNFLAIAHAGNGTMTFLDMRALRAGGFLENGGGRKLGALRAASARRATNADGLRTLAVAKDGVYGAGYFSDDIVFVPFNGAPRTVCVLGDGVKTASAVRRGEAYFHSAKLCFQEWQSCASCHPDARVDALDWDLLNDGVGNPKNTRSLLVSHETPPAMALGSRPNVEAAVRSGFKYIQFVEPDETICRDTDTYLRAQRPVPSVFVAGATLSGNGAGRPECARCHENRGVLSERAARGRALFRERGCVRCHPHPYFTDGLSHDVGTTRGVDAGKPVNTPSLLEVWRTAPYLHDGSAATLETAVFDRNPDGARGRTRDVSDGDKAALIEYLKSL